MLMNTKAWKYIHKVAFVWKIVFKMVKYEAKSLEIVGHVEMREINEKRKVEKD